ncbi:hypothetical protein CIHG_06902 [Coccidioides immitis H538.4]|uniref:Uncharacterized protein n=1 Tax=Coccidioides immitis H538.4 TaxID=396776 RepID=A0A0J8RWS3_COCIT|nr:hypothetical protein CIHG_06902 [Coccidioides immitis H538.4]
MGKVDYRITAKWAQLGVGKPGEHEAPDQSRKGRMTSGLCGERNIHSSLCNRDRTSHARPIRNSPAQREFCDTSAIKDDPAVVMRCSSATFLKRRLRKKKSRRWFTAKTKALLFITTRVAGSIADSHRDACHCRCPGDPNCSPFRLLRSLHSILINERPRISQAINS